MGAVRRPVIAGGGIREEDWQRCAWLAGLPAGSVDEVLGRAPRLVVVSPHPDDEVLACGGLVQAALAARRRVCVLSVTDGEACYPGQAAWPPERLRRARRQELAEALAVLGGVRVTVLHLGLRDGGVGDEEDVLAVQLLASLQPGDLVLAPWVHDGHPDHEATGRAAVRAARLANATLLQYPVWAWHWLDPQAPEPPWPRALRLALPDAARLRKHRAIAAFATQTGAVPGLDCPPILPAGVLARFQRDYEVLIR